jgi:hypothetical protein
VDRNLYSHDRLDYIHKLRQNLMNQPTDRMHNNHWLILNHTEYCTEKNEGTNEKLYSMYFGSLVTLFR